MLKYYSSEYPPLIQLSAKTLLFKKMCSLCLILHKNPVWAVVRTWLFSPGQPIFPAVKWNQSSTSVRFIEEQLFRSTGSVLLRSGPCPETSGSEGWTFNGHWVSRVEPFWFWTRSYLACLELGFQEMKLCEARTQNLLVSVVSAPEQ